MNKIVAVTSFGTQGYEETGHIMIESFCEYWPAEVKLCVYVDEIPGREQMIQNERVEYRLLNRVDLKQFKKRQRNNPEAHGLGKLALKDGKSEFKYNAVKFSHKVFALIDVIEKDSPDIAIWLDGDSRTHSTVTEDTINRWCPENCFAGFLDRPWLYTETGFHIFRTTHSMSRDFFNTWKNYYTNDTVFDLEYWTDCHTYDAARKQFDQRLWHNLSPDFNHPHPFINGVLGEVMDHMKGPRKQKGSSKKHDLAVKRSGYWDSI